LLLCFEMLRSDVFSDIVANERVWEVIWTKIFFPMNIEFFL